MNKICDELEARIGAKTGAFAEKTPRILVSGCLQAVPNWKLPFIVETSGAVIVGEESCVGERGTRSFTDSSGETVEAMMDAIVDRYFQVNCAIFTPNAERLNHIQEMVETYKADSVIHYGLQFCQPYLMESIPVEKALEAQKDLTISSMCTVFAESEVTSLIAKGENRREIARGLHIGVVRRAAGMINRISFGGDIVFTGGVAKNSCMAAFLSEKLDRKVLIPDNPQFVGVLGAALLAKESM